MPSERITFYKKPFEKHNLMENWTPKPEDEEKIAYWVNSFKDKYPEISFRRVFDSGYNGRAFIACNLD